jgi:hypothetical protein
VVTVVVTVVVVVAAAAMVVNLAPFRCKGVVRMMMY